MARLCSSRCPRCQKEVYFAEKVTSLGKDWHRPCLRCEKCNKTLTSGGHAEHDGKPYCNHPCYAALFGPKGGCLWRGCGGSEGARGSCLLASSSPRCARHAMAVLTLLHLFQGSAGEELRATRSNKPQVGPSLRAPLLSLAPWAGWGCPPSGQWGRQACHGVTLGWL
uniref:Cysteine rich protein 1 n=1 Tax=Taeniopygia guttata TaxID=59729 RepID=A0A674GSK1_TAEGU